MASAVQEGDDMTCPVCGGKTEVRDSCAEVDVIYRKRRCVECGHTFETEETECKLDVSVQRMRYEKRKRRTENERRDKA